MNGLAAFFVRSGLGFVSLPVWSRLWGRIVRLRRPRFLARWMIRSFQRAYGISMDEYLGTPEIYPSLSDFFVRPLDPGKRRLEPRPSMLLSPSDGMLSRLEHLSGDSYLQVKGHAYPLSAILGERPDFSHPWSVATIYLAPGNYHRFHYPASGRLTALVHTGRRLFPVNALSVGRVRRLFIRNERISVKMECSGHPLYIVAVGASFVGSIRMAFPTERGRRGDWLHLDLAVQQADEMGRFEQGSTIILAFPQAWAREWLVKEGDSLRAGQPICML